MLKLVGRADASGLARPAAYDVWRVCLPEDADRDRSGAAEEGPATSIACLLRDGQDAPPGYGLYLIAGHEPAMPGAAGSRGAGASGMPGPVLRLGPELAHLDAGDIIHVPDDGRRVTVLWKNSARHNALLLTEQCDNYCLMCSQPPKNRDDAWLFDRAGKVISLLPQDARALSLTGGEPTLHADALIGLLEHCKQVAPGLSVHLLSNGRRFADPEFTRRYAAVGLADIMAGIPGLRPRAGPARFHRPGRRRVQRDGARHPQPGLARPGGGDPGRRPAAHRPGAAEPGGIHRAKPAVRRPGSADGPGDDRPGPAERTAGMGRPRRRRVRACRRGRHTRYSQGSRRGSTTTSSGPGPAPVADAVRSISDWKNDYLDICRTCTVRDACGGVSPQAATASASTCTRYPDQPATTSCKDLRQGREPLPEQPGNPDPAARAVQALTLAPDEKDLPE